LLTVKCIIISYHI